MCKQCMQVYRQILIRLFELHPILFLSMFIRQVMQPAAAFVETLREIPKAMKDFLLNKARFVGAYLVLGW